MILGARLRLATDLAKIWRKQGLRLLPMKRDPLCPSKITKLGMQPFIGSDFPGYSRPISLRSLSTQLNV
jgi:hypothetical protein